MEQFLIPGAEITFSIVILKHQHYHATELKQINESI